MIANDVWLVIVTKEVYVTKEGFTPVRPVPNRLPSYKSPYLHIDGIIYTIEKSRFLARVH